MKFQKTMLNIHTYPTGTEAQLDYININKKWEQQQCKLSLQGNKLKTEKNPTVYDW